MNFQHAGHRLLVTPGQIPHYRNADGLGYRKNSTVTFSQFRSRQETPQRIIDVRVSAGLVYQLITARKAAYSLGQLAKKRLGVVRVPVFLRDVLNPVNI